MSARKKLYILGAGGLARELADLLRERPLSERYEFMGFLDKDEERAGEMVNDVPVLGTIAQVGPDPDAVIVAGAGNVEQRLRQIAEIESAGCTSCSLVHESAWVSPYAVVGMGAVMCQFTTLTANSDLGDYCLVNYGATIGHDVKIGRASIVGPGARVSGAVVLGDACYLGAGAVVLPGVTVGDRAMIGAGAVVTRDVPPHAVVAGVPARPLDPELKYHATDTTEDETGDLS